MFCPKCGEEARGSQRFCRGCGAPLAGGEPIQRTQMTSSYEKLLWGLKLERGYELLFTSERMVVQNPTGIEQTLRGASPLFGGVGAGFFATYHSETYVDPQCTINPARAAGSIEYSEISRLTIIPNEKGSVFTWQFFKGAEPKPIISIPLNDQAHKSSLSVVSPLFGDRVSVERSRTVRGGVTAIALDKLSPFETRKEWKELTRLSPAELHQYLVDIGLKVPPLEKAMTNSVGVSTKNIINAIRVLDANYDFVECSALTGLKFAFTNVRGKNKDDVRLKIVRSKEGVELKWKGQDKRLIEHCREDADFTRSIVDVSNKYKTDCSEQGWWSIRGVKERMEIRIGGEKEKTDLEYVVLVSQTWFKYPPPIELFQVMDRMGVLLRSLST